MRDIGKMTLEQKIGQLICVRWYNTEEDKRFLFDGEFVKNSNWFEDGVFKGNPGISINFITDKFSDILQEN